MSISKREIKLILCVIGVLLVVASFCFIFLPQQDKNSIIENDIVALRNELNNLKSLEIQKDDIIAEKEAAIAAQEEILNHFPANFYEEDVIMHANAIEKESDMVIPGVSLSGQTIAWSSPDNSVPYTMGSATAGYSFEVTYAGMKEVVNAINADSDYKSLDEVSLAYNSQSGELYGTLVVNHYFVWGTSKEYQGLDLSDISTGTPNIFGTISGGNAASSSDVTAEGEETVEGEEAAN